jgi:hypothetical protein
MTSLIRPPPREGQAARRAPNRPAGRFYDADGSDDGLEWIKLYNDCPTDAQLSTMSLGWGGSSYRAGRLQLQGTVAAGECFLVGGPVTDAVNGGPLLDDAVDLQPDLQNSGADADGIEEGTLPLDAVIYGTANTNGLLDPTGDAPAPHVGDAKAGESLQRVAADAWTIGAPAPSDCPSFGG